MNPSGVAPVIGSTPDGIRPSNAPSVPPQLSPRMTISAGLMLLPAPHNAAPFSDVSSYWLFRYWIARATE